jgi:hypothetical protein
MSKHKSRNNWIMKWNRRAERQHQTWNLLISLIVTITYRADGVLVLLVFRRFERFERSGAVERFERAQSPWTGSTGGHVDLENTRYTVWAASNIR